MPTSNNRTKWPVTGGALGWQPGWFAGHKTAFMFVNLGLGNEPLNMSNNMVPVFSINGPSDAMYPGSICLPQVPLPANVSVNVGDNATIQVVELAQHGAALYSVRSPRKSLFVSQLTKRTSASISHLQSQKTLLKSMGRIAPIPPALTLSLPSTLFSPRRISALQCLHAMRAFLRQ